MDFWMDTSNMVLLFQFCYLSEYNLDLGVVNWKFPHKFYIFHEAWACHSNSQRYLSFLFSFTLFHFTILYWFCHTSTWIHHRYTCVPNHEPFSHLPPHTISLGHPSAPAPSILYPASNRDWRFISYIILYMFQCHSPKSSHPLPLPQSPKDCSVHLCLFCCLTSRVMVTIFLNSIYMC